MLFDDIYEARVSSPIYSVQTVRERERVCVLESGT